MATVQRQSLIWCHSARFGDHRTLCRLGAAPVYELHTEGVFLQDEPVVQVLQTSTA